MNTAALSGFSELDDGDFIDQSDYNYKTLDFSSQLSSFQCIMQYYISFHHIPINFPFLIQLNLQCNLFSGSPHWFSEQISLLSEIYDVVAQN